jgi:hypothetical protein
MVDWIRNSQNPCEVIGYSSGMARVEHKTAYFCFFWLQTTYVEADAELSDKLDETHLETHVL